MLVHCKGPQFLVKYLNGWSIFFEWVISGQFFLMTVSGDQCVTMHPIK